MATSKQPNGAEIAFVVICSLLLVVNCAALVYCYIKRYYMPIRSTNLVNMYITYVAMMMSFIGSVFVSNSQFADKEWAVCAVTIGWLGMSLGVFLFVAMMLLRVYNYIGIFMLNRRNTGIYFIIPVAYVTGISILYGVLAFVINPSSGYSYDPATNMCIVGTPIYIVGVVLLAVQGILMCAMLVKARKMECCFHEYRNMLITFGVCIVAGIIIIVLRFVKIGSDGTATGILKMIFIFIPQQVYFYMILGVPIYHSIRDSEEYLTYFIDRIEGQGLSPVYEMAGKCSLGEISNMSEYNQSRGVSIQKRITGTSQFSGNVPAPDSVGDSSRHSPTTAHEPNQESTFSYVG